ncbi:hypothetical protein ONA92_17305 [Mycobacteroides salmoniphilum]|uniref:hypothetical protein n=1 Tax=Mycobacteroides salmoniphilum TaxID=404941 RepID=UPI003568A3FA
MSSTADDADVPAPEWDLSGIPTNTRDLQQSTDWYGAPDSQLQRMSQWANQMEEGIGITLVVPGGALSGTVVSAREFYTGVAAALRGTIDEKGDEAQSKLADAFAEFFFDQPAKAAAEQVDKDDQAFKDGGLIEPIYMMARYIHLKDALHSVPGQSDFPLDYTRVLLSQVVAWSIGQRWSGQA